MKKTGFAKRRDKNEPGIVKALVAVGCVVQPLNGTGVPDLLVGFAGRTFLFEVKGPLNSKGKPGSHVLTPDQETWFAAWQGKPPIIVRSPEDALAAIGLSVVSPGMYTFCPEHEGAPMRCDGSSAQCCCADKHILSTYPRSKT